MSLALLILGAFCVVYFCYWLTSTIKYRKQVNAFPRRPTWPFFGDIFSLSTNPEKLFAQLTEYNKEFPNGFAIWGAQYAAINLNTAEDLEVILTNSKNIEKSIIYTFLHPWLSTGLLTSAGKKWQHRRKLLTPAFHFNILKRFVTIFGEHGRHFIKKLEDECNKPKTNVVPLVSKLTLSIICETAMGISLDYDNEKQVKYTEAIHEIGPLLINCIFKPWLYYPIIYNLTREGKLVKKYIKTLHEFSTNVIKERERTFSDEEMLKQMEDSDENEVYSKKRFAMLDLLISAKRNNDITDEGIREEVDTFMFEGHDTTSMAISFAILMLANHKEIQEKVRNEVLEIFQNSNQTATYEELQNMHYLEMFLKEVLRLYPSVPFIGRSVTEDFELNGRTVPKGCFLDIFIYYLHRDPRVFPDPEKFDPDRFLPENVKGRHPYAYVPFSAGLRNCIGQKFAMLEMKSVISTILCHYEIDPIDSPASIVMISDMVLRTKDGIHVKFKPRLIK